MELESIVKIVIGLSFIIAVFVVIKININKKQKNMKSQSGNNINQEISNGDSNIQTGGNINIGNFSSDKKGDSIDKKE